MERTKEPYIFLDIDGVLATNQMPKVSKSEWYNDKAYPFNKNCVNILNKILAKTDAHIILSSDWRRVFDLDELDKIFKFNQVIKSPIDTTSVLFNRDNEIRNYVITKHLSKFVIIDDSYLLGFQERFIRTNPQKGLQSEHLKRIEKLLK